MSENPSQEKTREQQPDISEILKLRANHAKQGPNIERIHSLDEELGRQIAKNGIEKMTGVLKDGERVEIRLPEKQSVTIEMERDIPRFYTKGKEIKREDAEKVIGQYPKEARAEFLYQAKVLNLDRRRERKRDYDKEARHNYAHEKYCDALSRKSSAMMREDSNGQDVADTAGDRALGEMELTI